MKPLERIFFIACINTLTTPFLPKPIYIKDLVGLFENFGFSKKQLYYYVEKWANNGFYSYGVSIRVGWFEIDKLNGEYKVLYEKYKRRLKND